MKRRIYFIPAEQWYPVGEAGAVIVANSPEEATAIAKAQCGLLEQGKPQHVGWSNLSPQVILSNNCNY